MKVFFTSCLILTMILLSLVLPAQHECGSDVLHQFKMETDKVYAEAFNTRQKAIAKFYDAPKQMSGGLYTIPVVVHVIHLGEAVGIGSNISDVQILDAITGLNEKFSNTNGVGTDIDIEFCLAVRDPFGCPTNGIVRVDGTVLPGYAASGIDYPDDVDCGGAPDVDVKALSTWPVLDYYNIWVVHTICEGWAGYAYYPNGQSYDGTVILDNYFTYSSTTMTHEMGHAFDLPHTFNGDEGNSICPPNDDCLFEGDYVCDTPPHKQGDCDVTNPCTAEGVWDNSRFNFMSYCGSTNRFTPDQKTRMQATLSVFPRMNLLSSMGCVPSDFATESTVNAISCVGGCDGSLTVEPTCPGTYSYFWDIDEVTPTISGLCPGVYGVEITNEDGLMATFSFELAEPDTFEIYIDSLFSICEGESIQLEVTGNGDFSWLPVEGLDDAGISNPTSTPLETITYEITGTSPLGCVDSTEVTVVVFELPEATIFQSVDTLYALPAGQTYQWYSDGVLMEGETDEYIVADGDGEFSVVVTDENNCSDESDVFSYVGVVENVFGNGSFIYPNPGDGLFSLSLHSPTNEFLTFDVYDNVGRIVFSKTQFITNGDTSIVLDMRHLSDGIYLMKAVKGDLFEMMKLVVAGE